MVTSVMMLTMMILVGSLLYITECALVHEHYFCRESSIRQLFVLANEYPLSAHFLNESLLWHAVSPQL